MDQFERRTLFKGMMNWNGGRKPFRVSSTGDQYELSLGLQNHRWKFEGCPDENAVRARLQDYYHATDIDFSKKN